jgi:hypothetical protein
MITAKLIFNVDGYIPRHLPPPFASAGAAGNMKDSTCVGSQVTPFHLHIPLEEDLYPTLTLHSPATKVWCRFCAQDILSNSRESIGAPEGATIYAVDGSVIFDNTAVTDTCLG